MHVKGPDLRKAEKFVAQGKLKKAINLYSDELRKFPTDHNILNTIGDLFIRIGEPKSAVPHFQKAADSLEKSGFRAKAIAILRKAYRQAPSNMEIVSTLANLLKEEGLRADARSLLVELANNRYKLGKTQEAKLLYRNVLEIDPQHLPTLLKLSELAAQEGNVAEECDAYHTVAQRLAESGKYDEAIEILDSAHSAAPDHIGIATLLGELLRKVGDYDKSKEILKKLSSTNADDPSLSIGLAELALEEGDMQSAVNSFNKLRELDPDSEKVRLLGSRIAISGGNYDEALIYLQPLIDEALATSQGGPVLAVLEEIISLDPNHIKTLKKLKNIYTYIKDKPNLIKTISQLTEAYESAGDFKLAIDAAEQLQGLEPDKIAHKSRLENLYSKSEGSVLFSEDSLAKEAEDLPETMEIDIRELDLTAPESEAASILLEVDVFFRYGLLQKAKERLEEALESDPNEPRVHEYLGNLYAEEYQFDTAILSYNTAADLWEERGNPDKVAEMKRIMQDLKTQAEDMLSETILGASDDSDLGGESIEVDETPAAEEVAVEALEIDPLQDKLSEVEYYLDQHFISAAHQLLTSLKEDHPDHPEIQRQWGVLQEMMQAELDVSEVEKDLDDFFAPLEEKNGAVESEAEMLEELEVQVAEQASISVSEPTESVEASSPLLDIAGSLEEELSAFHSAAEKHFDELSHTKKKVDAERILSHIGIEGSVDASQEDAGAHFEMGNAYFEIGLHEEAITEFQLSAEDPAYHQQSCLKLGVCFHKKGMDSVAVAWLQRGITGGGDEKLMADTLHQLALIYQIQGHSERFNNAMEQLESMAPDHPGIAALKASSGNA